MPIKIEHYSVIPEDPFLTYNFPSGRTPADPASLRFPSTLVLSSHSYARLQPESNIKGICTSMDLALVILHSTETTRSVILSFDEGEDLGDFFKSQVDFLRQGQSTATIEVISVLGSKSSEGVTDTTFGVGRLSSSTGAEVRVSYRGITYSNALGLSLARSDSLVTMFYPSAAVPSFRLFGADDSHFSRIHPLICALQGFDLDTGERYCLYDGIKRADRLPPLTEYGAATMGLAQVLEESKCLSTGAGGGGIRPERFPGLRSKVQALLQMYLGGDIAPGLQAARTLLSANPFCSVCAREKEDGDLKRCSGCEEVYYCSQAHQKEDWPFHREL